MTLADDALLADLTRMHEQIRQAVARRLHAARAAGDHGLASRPVGWGVGDLTFALDEVADGPIAELVTRVGARRPVVVVAEGPGELRGGDELRATGGAEATPSRADHGPAPDEPAAAARSAPPSDAASPVRLLIDPIDGTRPLMLDMRSAWVLTGVAPDRGDDTRLSHIELALQTELPTTGAAVYHVLLARRGQGASISRHDVATGALLDQRPLRVSQDLPLDNGMLSFTRYLPVERAYVAELERRFLEAAIPALGLDPHLLFDDQYLCTAGQLFLTATGRYRMLADLRGWLGRTRGLANFAVKPYDLSTALIFEEAGVPLADAAGAPLDGPLDTHTPLDVVAYANERVAAAFDPHLRAVMASLEE